MADRDVSSPHMISRVQYDISSEHEIIIVVLICISYSIATLLIARYCTSISQAGSHVPWFHPSSVAALIGLLIGGIISSFNITILFSDSVFFYVVLPPIIFTAGYTLKKKKFFTYLHQIALYGLIGSIVNFIFIAFAAYYYTSITLTWNQALLLSSVLAANDEISAISLIKQSDFPRLGALLFGEGVLNDALSIVLFQALLSISHKPGNSNIDPSDNLYKMALPFVSLVIYQLIISCLIGLICGLGNARLLKVFTFSRKHPVHQTTLVMLTGYLAYSVAEAVDVSGILALFVTAVTMSHYSWHSLSKSAKLASRITFVSLSDAAEGFAFAYVGLSLWVVVKGPINLTFSFYMLAVVLISRFVTIVILAWIYDLMMGKIRINLSPTSVFDIIQRKPDIPFLELVAFSLGGVVRGCLCWAQVLQIGGGLESQILVQTTLVIILATTIGSGFILPLAIPRLTNMLQDPKNVNFKHHRSRRSSPSKSSDRNGNDDDEEASTYSMHLEGSVNESDEELEHMMTPRAIGSRAKNDGGSAITSAETSSILHGESKTDYHSFDEDYTRHHNGHDNNPYVSLSTQNMDENLRLQALTERDKSTVSIRNRKLHKYSLLFILWIRIDEQYLKPWFGGSTLGRKKAKSKVLTMTKSLKAYEMLSPVRMIAVESDVDLDEDDKDQVDDFDKVEDIYDDYYDPLNHDSPTHPPHQSIRREGNGNIMVNFQSTFDDLSLFPHKVDGERGAGTGVYGKDADQGLITRLFTDPVIDRL